MFRAMFEVFYFFFEFLIRFCCKLAKLWVLKIIQIYSYDILPRYEDLFIAISFNCIELHNRILSYDICFFVDFCNNIGKIKTHT